MTIFPLATVSIAIWKFYTRYRTSWRVKWVCIEGIALSPRICKLIIVSIDPHLTRVVIFTPLSLNSLGCWRCLMITHEPVIHIGCCCLHIVTTLLCMQQGIRIRCLASCELIWITIWDRILRTSLMSCRKHTYYICVVGCQCTITVLIGYLIPGCEGVLGVRLWAISENNFNFDSIILVRDQRSFIYITIKIHWRYPSKHYIALSSFRVGMWESTEIQVGVVILPHKLFPLLEHDSPPHKLLCLTRTMLPIERNRGYSLAKIVHLGKE